MNKLLLSTIPGFLLSLSLALAAGAQQDPPPEEEFRFTIGAPGPDRPDARRAGPEAGGPGEGAAPNDEPAPAATAQVIAVADARSNSIIVRGPAHMLGAVEELLAKVDAIGERRPRVSVRPLRYANAEDMADLIERVFADSSNQRGSLGRTTSATDLQVSAAADLRTNSVIVSAGSDKMPFILSMVDSLDKNPAREQRVHVYQIKYADTAAVAEMLQTVIENQSRRGSGSSPGTSSYRGSGTRAESSFAQGNQGSSPLSSIGQGSSGFGFGDSSGSSGFGGGR